MATARPMTIEELAQLPEDEGRYELLDGELIEMAPTGFEHGKLSNRIGRLLGNVVDDQGLGIVCGAETGYVLRRNPNRLLAPDVSFVRADRLPPDDEQTGFLELAPDLVVEVVSPFDRWSEVETKSRAYLEAGVQLVWLVDPSKRLVEVRAPNLPNRTLMGDDILTGGDVLPEFQLPLSKLFG